MAPPPSSYPPSARNNFTQLGTGLGDTMNEPSTQKWSITSHDDTLVSSPIILHNSKANNACYTDEFHVDHERKLNEVRDLLNKVGEDYQLEGLVMIDAIQCLNIDYHFRKEIESILQSQDETSRVHENDEHDLYQTALRFRLLRQEGHFVSAEVFDKFKNKEGKFKQELVEDIRGMMGLYEAAQLRIEGEHILDEAESFCRRLFKACMPYLNSHEARLVESMIKHPYRKSLSRIGAKNFANNFQGNFKWITVLEELSNLDLKIVQSIHQKELQQISHWWEELGLAKELKLARDQPLKWHMWSMEVLTDPSLSEQRIGLTKPISLVYIIDDIFDVYGTLDELTLFTEAVTRWEFTDVNQLPNYMRTCFQTLFDITYEIGYKFFIVHGWNPIDTLRKSWVTLCKAFLAEAKWFASGELPKADKYLKNGIISSGVHVVLVHMFFLLGQDLSKECLDLVNDNNNIPGIINFTATILRLWDDLGSAKDENQDGYDGSYLECFMNEHKGLLMKTAREHMIGMISDAWKCLNKECLSPNPFSSSFTKASLNAARMVPLMYNYDDNHCLPDLEEHAMFVLNMINVT